MKIVIYLGRIRLVLDFWFVLFLLVLIVMLCVIFKYK